MSSHTPGPWACTYTSNYAHDYRLTQPNGQPLPINAEANDRSEQRANARLIAAAPDLLAALIQIIGDGAKEDTYGYHAAHNALNNEKRAAAAAAIAKATQE